MGLTSSPSFPTSPSFAGLTSTVKPDFQINTGSTFQPALRLSNLIGSGQGAYIEAFTGFGSKVVGVLGFDASGSSGASFTLRLLRQSTGVLTTSIVIDNAGTVAIVGTTAAGNASAGNIGEQISASVIQGSAVALTTATPKTVTSISLTAGDWDVTAIGAITGASTGTVFDVAISANTDSFTGTVPGDSRCQSPTVSLTGADASLMIPQFRVNISSTTTYYLVVQEVFTIGSPAAYGRISARRRR